MTTIAWDGMTIAADSQSTTGGRMSFRDNKIIPGDGASINGRKVIYIGLAGTSGDERHIISWLSSMKDENGVEREMNPEVDCIVMLITAEGNCFTVQKNKDNSVPWIYESHAPYAIGSGADFAISAMHLGFNAKDAVSHACELDAYSGGEIKSFDVTYI